MNFVKTRKYGVVWRFADDFTWAQWFSLNIWPKFPVFIGGLFGALIASAVALVVVIVGGEAMNDSDSWTTLQSLCFAIAGYALVAVPTALVRRCVSNMQKSSRFRFGPMADGSPLLPTLMVLRHYNQLSVPLGVSFIERQWQINNWLRDTWESDAELLRTIKESRNETDRLRWLSLKERIASFSELPDITRAYGFQEKMYSLSAGLYGLARSEADHRVELQRVSLLKSQASYDAAIEGLTQLRAQAPTAAQ